METGRLLADQIGSTALELKGRFPIALSGIAHTRRMILVGIYRLVTFVVVIDKLDVQPERHGLQELQVFGGPGS